VKFSAYHKPLLQLDHTIKLW